MIKKLLFSCAFFLISPLSNAAQIIVAVASNFSEPAKQIAKQFEHKYNTKVIISSAGTGVLANQIKNGAPYEILLSADKTTPQQLIQDGYAVKDTQFTYAQGQLVLWSKQTNFITNDANILKTNKFNFLAIANPKLAPYGSAAMQTLAKLGLTESIKNKIVTGDNISNTYQFVATGNADLGFVALSQIMNNGKITAGSYWIVPQNITPLIQQDAIILNVGKNNPASQQFMNFIKSKTVQQIIKSYGYQ